MGIRDDAVRSRLLRETDLDLQKAVDICRAAEQTRSHMDALKNSTSTIDEVTKDPLKSKRTDSKNKTRRKHTVQILRDVTSKRQKQVSSSWKGLQEMW